GGRKAGPFSLFLQSSEVVAADVCRKLSPQSSLSFFRPRFVMAAASVVWSTTNFRNASCATGCGSAAFPRELVWGADRSWARLFVFCVISQDTDDAAAALAAFPTAVEFAIRSLFDGGWIAARRLN